MNVSSWEIFIKTLPVPYTKCAMVLTVAGGSQNEFVDG